MAPPTSAASGPEQPRRRRRRAVTSPGRIPPEAAGGPYAEEDQSAPADSQVERHGTSGVVPMPPEHPDVPVAPVAPPPQLPARRRKVVVGLAAEAAAQAERAQRASEGDNHGSHGQAVPAVAVGACRCGLPATTSCASGCGSPTCSQHLLNGASRLSWPGPYRSEREHTAYLRAFWASSQPLCTWCREGAGVAALAALLPVAPLPGDLLERLTVLLRYPHDYPGDCWAQTVQEQGGAAAVLRLLGPQLCRRRSPQEFDGRRKGDVLAGVSVGWAGTLGTYEVVDGGGTLWVVRPMSSLLVRNRRVWSWQRAPEERVDELLPRIVELSRR